MTLRTSGLASAAGGSEEVLAGGAADPESGADRLPRAARGPWLGLACGLLLVVGGGILARHAHTDGGRVEVRDVRFQGADGATSSALLYVPLEATPEQPAPGVLAVHGYINSRETQSGFAIEYARRGYVVLSLDQRGHGYSDPPAFAAGFGGPEGLRYLRSLPYVDPERIGLEGHSMGGWAVLMAAAAEPDGYRAVVLVGSSSGSAGTRGGTAEFPRNLGLVFSTWDEFSQLMWDAPVGAEIVATEKLRAQFGTIDPVEAGVQYGSLEQGTARRLYMPRATHPQGHLSTEAIGAAVDWMQRALPPPRPLSPDDQLWPRKEAGTLLAGIGALLATLALGAQLLRVRGLGELRRAPSASRGSRGVGWWIAALLTGAIPALTYLELLRLGPVWLPPSSLWPQQITTGLAVWAIGNGTLALLGFALWHVTSGGLREARAVAYGLCWPGIPLARGLAKSLLLAGLLLGFVQALLWLCQALLLIDLRFWVVGLKPLDASHARIALGYLPPFLAFMLVGSLVLHGQLRRAGLGPFAEHALNALLLTSGISVLLAVQYVPLLAGAPLPLGEPLASVIALQLVPVLTIVAIVSTALFRLTGSIYPGALVNALWVTGYVVAGQATHVAL